MATSKVFQGFVPTLITDYTELLTLESDVTISSFRLEQLDANIWSLFIAGTMTEPMAANSRRNIATYDLTKLAPVTGYIGGYVYPQNQASIFLPGVGFLLNNGDVRVLNLSSSEISGFSFNGMVYRRL